MKHRRYMVKYYQRRIKERLCHKGEQVLRKVSF